MCSFYVHKGPLIIAKVHVKIILPFHSDQIGVGFATVCASKRLLVNEICLQFIPWVNNDSICESFSFSGDPPNCECSCCGNINKNLKLSDRTYKCPTCGFEEDRDINAALNLKNSYKIA